MTDAKFNQGAVTLTVVQDDFHDFTLNRVSGVHRNSSTILSTEETIKLIESLIAALEWIHDNE